MSGAGQPSPGVWYLTIDRCERHGYYAISLDHDSNGLRLTRAKCCGTWTAVKRFAVDPKDLAVDVIREWRGLTQEQWFDLTDRIESLLPERDEDFRRGVGAEPAPDRARDPWGVLANAFGDFLEAALEIADTEGMSDETRLPVWPDGNPAGYPELTVGSLRVLDAAIKQAAAASVPEARS